MEAPDAYALCQTFRRMARKAGALKKRKDLSTDQNRTVLIEEVVDLCSELDVWHKGIVKLCSKAAVALLDGEDDRAASIFTELADGQLEILRQPEPPDEFEEGDESHREESEEDGEG